MCYDDDVNPRALHSSYPRSDSMSSYGNDRVKYKLGHWSLSGKIACIDFSWCIELGIIIFVLFNKKIYLVPSLYRHLQCGNIGQNKFRWLLCGLTKSSLIYVAKDIMLLYFSVKIMIM